MDEKHNSSVIPNSITNKNKLHLSKRMLDVNELAEYIGLSPQTIRNKYCADKFPIPAKKIFSKLLWDIRDVDRFLDKLTHTS